MSLCLGTSRAFVLQPVLDPPQDYVADSLRGPSAMPATRAPWRPFAGTSSMRPRHSCGTSVPPTISSAPDGAWRILSYTNHDD